MEPRISCVGSTCRCFYTLKRSGFYIFAHYNQCFPVSSLPEEVSHNFGSDRMSTHVGCGVSSLSRSTPNGNHACSSTVGQQAAGENR